MAQGDRYRIPGRKIEAYKEYKLQPSDLHKGLKQIAREQLGDESLYTLILRKTGDPKTQGAYYEEIPNKDHIGSDWTLLLPEPPASDYATFKLRDTVNIRTSPEVNPNNVHSSVGIIGTVWTYKKSTVRTDKNGMRWADVTTTPPPNKVAGVTYWICVREGNITHTDPPI